MSGGHAWAAVLLTLDALSVPVVHAPGVPEVGLSSDGPLCTMCGITHLRGDCAPAATAAPVSGWHTGPLTEGPRFQCFCGAEHITGACLAPAAPEEGRA